LEGGVDGKGADRPKAANREQGSALEGETATEVLDDGNVLGNHLTALLEQGGRAVEMHEVGADLHRGLLRVGLGANDVDAAGEGLGHDLKAVFPPQLLGVQGRDLDGVICKLAGGGKQRNGLGKEPVVRSLHLNGSDEHRVPGILVGLEDLREAGKQDGLQERKEKKKSGSV